VCLCVNDYLYSIYISTSSHTHTHTHTLLFIIKHTHNRSLPFTHTQSLTHTRTYIYIHIPPAASEVTYCSCVRVSALVQSWRRGRSVRRAYENVYTYKHIHTHTLSCTHTHTHTSVYSHTHMHTLSHTHLDRVLVQRESIAPLQLCALLESSNHAVYRRVYVCMCVRAYVDICVGMRVFCARVILFDLKATVQR
jgi:hypothetical protein